MVINLHGLHTGDDNAINRILISLLMILLMRGKKGKKFSNFTKQTSYTYITIQNRTTESDHSYIWERKIPSSQSIN